MGAWGSRSGQQDQPPAPASISAAGEYDRAVAVHAAHYAALLEREGPRLHGAGEPDGGRVQLLALARLRLELANALGALDTSVQRQDLALLLPLAQPLAALLLMSNAFLQCREAFDQVLETARAVGSRPLELEALLGSGGVVWIMGDREARRNRAEAAHGIARELADVPGQARAIRQQALIAALSDYSAARELHAQELALLRPSGQRGLEADALVSLGRTEYRLGNYAVAQVLCEQGLELQRSIGDCWGEAKTLGNLALIAVAVGDNATARSLHQAALQLNLTLGDRHGQALCHSGLGLLEYSLGNYSAARAKLDLALDDFTSLGNDVLRAGALHNLGLVESARGDYAAARQLTLRARALNQQLGHRNWEAYNLAALGTLEFYLNNPSEGRRLYDTGLTSMRSLGDRAGEAASLAALAAHEVVAGRFDLADALVTRALHLREWAARPGLINLCASAAVILADKGRWPDAALVLHASLVQAAEAGHHFHAARDDSRVRDAGLALLRAAVESGALEEAAYAELQQAAQALSLDELAEIAALALGTPAGSAAAGT